MIRVLGALVMTLLAWCGLVQPAQAVVSVPTAVVTVYVYDGHAAPAQVRNDASGRGPSATYGRFTEHGGVDVMSLDVPLSPEPRGSRAHAAYASVVRLPHGCSASVATEEDTQGASACSAAPGEVRVAAKSEASVLRHYTTSEAAESISKGGSINPGASGKIWLTPDKYATGAEARAKLALNKTPDGYFEIPTCRVSCPSPPSRVQPYYGQPGGGIEITTGSSIDVSGLIFRKLG